jgi:hypothetical protein
MRPLHLHGPHLRFLKPLLHIIFYRRKQQSKGRPSYHGPFPKILGTKICPTAKAFPITIIPSAIGALYRQIVRQSDDSGEEASIYYGKALKSLNQRLGNSDSSWEIALFGSILFIVFEVLRGSDVGALKHLEGALRLMKESITRFPVSD